MVWKLKTASNQKKIQGGSLPPPPRVKIFVTNKDRFSWPWCSPRINNINPTSTIRWIPFSWKKGFFFSKMKNIKFQNFNDILFLFKINLHLLQKYHRNSSTTKSILVNVRYMGYPHRMRIRRRLYGFSLIRILTCRAYFCAWLFSKILKYKNKMKL